MHIIVQVYSIMSIPVAPTSGIGIPSQPRLVSFPQIPKIVQDVVGKQLFRNYSSEHRKSKIFHEEIFNYSIIIFINYIKFSCVLFFFRITKFIITILSFFYIFALHAEFIYFLLLLLPHCKECPHQIY